MSAWSNEYARLAHDEAKRSAAADLDALRERFDPSYALGRRATETCGFCGRDAMSDDPVHDVKRGGVWTRERACYTCDPYLHACPHCGSHEFFGDMEFAGGPQPYARCRACRNTYFTAAGNRRLFEADLTYDEIREAEAACPSCGHRQAFFDAEDPCEECGSIYQPEVAAARRAARQREATS